MRPVVAPGQLWWHQTRMAWLMVLSNPIETAVGPVVQARRLGRRGTRDNQPMPRRLDGKVLEPPVSADGRMIDAEYETTVPILRCRSMYAARLGSYMLRPHGMPDAFAVGAKLIAGADLDPRVAAERSSSSVVLEWAEPEEVMAWRAELAAAFPVT